MAASSSTSAAAVTATADVTGFGVARDIASAWPTGVDRVYVVCAGCYYVSTAAATQASLFDAPTLLTRQGSLPAETATALRHLQPERIVVVGGDVSDGVLQGLRKHARSGVVNTVTGTGRYQIVAKVAGRFPQQRPRAIVASGRYPRHALAGAYLAGRHNLPLFLTGGGKLHDAAVNHLNRLGVGDILVVGSTRIVSNKVASHAASLSTSGKVTRRYDVRDLVAQATATFPEGVGVEQAGSSLTQTSLVSSALSSVFAGYDPSTAPGLDTPEPSPSPGTSVSTGFYNGMGGTDDEALLELLGGMPLTHAASYYTSGEVNDYWPKPHDRERLANGTTLLLDIQAKNWRRGGPDSFMAWPDIAAGKHDAEIRDWGRKMAALEGEIWFSFDQEPAVKMHHGKVPSHWTPEDYAAANRRISRLVRAEAPNVKFTFWVGGSHRDLIQRAYPGDEAVDIICWDPYVHAGKSPDMTPYQLWSSFSTWLDSRSWGKGKTRGLCETGFDNRHPDEKGAAFWKQAPEAARRLDLAFVTLFHRNSGPLGNYTMENMPLTRRAYAQAMRDLQN
ncbi:cell wall-binding repeat-containing protein [Ornithinicoccus halotolerans]|uniref:cell wall-binding repeat-containing protein n=1 Tax=Ornithinicoccus halotolerans TaxID=1748220 RepID=UPI001885F985|nr:cell wall-binding repeat-containing protein [Ornithinicoccus halotolerans]